MVISGVREGRAARVRPLPGTAGRESAGLAAELLAGFGADFDETLALALVQALAGAAGRLAAGMTLALVDAHALHHPLAGGSGQGYGEREQSGGSGGDGESGGFPHVIHGPCPPSGRLVVGMPGGVSNFSAGP